MKDINEVIKMYKELLVDEKDDEQVENYKYNINFLEKKLEKKEKGD